jgi:hypothetical protein
LFELQAKGDLDHQIFHKIIRSLQLSLPFEVAHQVMGPCHELSDEDKKEYFKNKMKRINNLHQHMDMTVNSIKFVISAAIVNMIIGNIFFHNDEQLFNDTDTDNDTTVVKVIVKRAAKKSKQKVNAMKLFIKQSNESTFKVIIKNVMGFELAMDHVSIDRSF